MPEVPVGLVLVGEEGRVRMRPLTYHAADHEEARRIAGAMRETLRRCAGEARKHGGG